MRTTIEQLKFNRYVAIAGFNVYEARTYEYVIRIHRNPNAGPGSYDWQLKIYCIPEMLPDLLTGEEIYLGKGGYGHTKRDLVAKAQRFIAGDKRWWMGEEP